MLPASTHAHRPSKGRGSGRPPPAGPRAHPASCPHVRGSEDGMSRLAPRPKQQLSVPESPAQTGPGCSWGVGCQAGGALRAWGAAGPAPPPCHLGGVGTCWERHRKCLLGWANVRCWGPESPSWEDREGQRREGHRKSPQGCWDKPEGRVLARMLSGGDAGAPGVQAQMPWGRGAGSLQANPSLSPHEGTGPLRPSREAAAPLAMGPRREGSVAGRAGILTSVRKWKLHSRGPWPQEAACLSV